MSEVRHKGKKFQSTSKQRYTKPRVNRNMSVAGGAAPSDRYAWITFIRRGVINNIGNANANETFLITDPQNIDFAHAGTSVNLPFWSARAVEYRKFRVVSANVNVSFSCNEPGGALVSMTPVNKAIAQNDAAYDVLLDQPNTLTKYLGPPGGNGTGYLQHSYTTAGLGGSPDVKANDFYSGDTDVTTAGRPSNNWYVVVGASIDGATQTVGVNFRITVKTYVRFYEINDPTN